MSNTPRIDALDKNYIINGDMFYYQRRGLNGTGLTTTDRYELDRWLSTRAGTWTGNPTFKRAYDINITGYPNITTALWVSSLPATQYPSDATATLTEKQRIESIFAKDLANEKVSLSFLYNESTFQEIDIEFYYPVSKDNFGSLVQIGTTQTIQLTNDSSWQSAVLEDIAMPSQAINGIEVRIIRKNAEFTGVDFDSYLTGFKLNLGEVAQEFSLAGRDLIEELQLCQRYYEKSYNHDVEPGTAAATGVGEVWFQPHASTTLQQVCHVDFKVQKRINPSMTPYSPQSGGTNFELLTTGTDYSGGFQGTGTHGTNPRLSSGHVSSVGFRVHWTADAEL